MKSCRVHPLHPPHQVRAEDGWGGARLWSGPPVGVVIIMSIKMNKFRMEKGKGCGLEKALAVSVTIATPLHMFLNEA